MGLGAATRGGARHLVLTDMLVDAAAAIARVESRARHDETMCGDGTMSWRMWGDGRPLVLLHGASGSWRHWIRNIEPLAARFQVLVPDMPGYGDSATPPEPHTADGLADLVTAGLAAIAPVPVDVAGFSFGGIIAGLVAARLGARVRTVVLLGPGGLALPWVPPPSLVRVGDNASPAEVTETHRENLRRLMLAGRDAADDLAVLVQIENLRLARFKSGTIPVSDVLRRALPAIRARVAAIWGEHDAYAGPYLEERRRLLASFQADLEFRVISGAGHWVIYEAADTVNAALLDILG